jgi:hypothetical protein
MSHFIHPGSTKMYQDLRQHFWWTRMKREIAKYVSECDTCQRVKASHLKASGTLQPLPILSWKREDISMDFIVDLPNTSQKYDSIWVIIDRLTKTAHFLPCIPLILLRSMPKSILIKLFGCMVSLRPLFLIEGSTSLHASRNNCSLLLEPN